MRLRSSFFVLAVAVAVPAPAQTTGVAGINDYTLNGMVPGSTSCTAICVPTPAPLTLSVSTAPGNAVIFMFTGCSCFPCLFAWPSNSCLPSIPSTGTLCSGPPTNQSVDLPLVLGCPIFFTSFMFADSTGNATQTHQVPSFGPVTCGTICATQAVVFDLCGLGGPPVGPGPWILTQSYSVNF